MLKLNNIAEKLVRNVKIRKLASFTLKLKKNLSDRRLVSPKMEELKLFSIELISKSNILKDYFSIKDTKRLIEKEKNISVITRILTIFLYMNEFEIIEKNH